MLNNSIINFLIRSLKLVKKVGQRNNPKEAFYLPYYMFNLECKNEKYYVFEEHQSDQFSMSILDEQTGFKVKTIPINEFLKCSYIDNDNRLIIVDSQKIIFMNADCEILKEIKIKNCPEAGYFWHFDQNFTLHLCTYNLYNEKNRKLLFKKLKF